PDRWSSPHCGSRLGRSHADEALPLLGPARLEFRSLDHRPSLVVEIDGRQAQFRHAVLVAVVPVKGQPGPTIAHEDLLSARPANTPFGFEQFGTAAFEHGPALTVEVRAGYGVGPTHHDAI